MSTTATTLAEAQQRFSDEGLPFPWVPPEMAADFAKVDEWVYSTRSDTPNPYDFGWFSKEVATQPVDDYVLVGHAGRGTNSYAIHYYLVRGPLALFLQLSWGGAYTDNAKAAQKLTTAFTKAEVLARAVAAAQQAARFQADERLILTISDMSGSYWIRLQGTTDTDSFIRSPDWQQSDAVLNDVLAVVQEQ